MDFDDHTYSQAGLRASDADRERAADLLRAHHAEGRLRDDEFEERIERCYQARTLGELSRLTADLPRNDWSPAFRGPEWLAGRRGRSPALMVVAVLGVLWVVSAIVSSLTWGWGWGHGGYHHGPGLLPLALLAFVAWRIWSRRGWAARRAG